MSNEIYKVNKKDSAIRWSGHKAIMRHKGTIKLSSGVLVVDNNDIISGYFDIDMNSTDDEDLNSNSELKMKLLNHLKSDDFFSVEKYPKARFELIEAKPIKGFKEDYNIKGILTIKGIKNTISFPAKITIDKNKMSAEADFKIDRTQWNIRYGSGKFFKSLGDNLISDYVDIQLKLVAEK